jgi:hypothetical protein
MDTTSKNAPDNVSRPRDGKNVYFEDLSFKAKQSSKTERFDALQQRIAETEGANQTIDDKTMERFFNDITDKSTTAKELHQASDVLRRLAKYPEVLSEVGQSMFMDAIPNIANHRNADYAMARESKETLSEVSKHLPQLAEGAQEKFFNNVTALSSANQDTEWKSKIAVNVADGSENGLGDINGAAQNQYVNIFGNVAQNILSLSQEEQAQFQRAAIELMQKTQFPYKFDANSLREALFAVPEDIRTLDYRTQLAEFEKNFIPSSDMATVQKTSPEIPKPIIHEEYVPAVPIEILPQALPIAPESLRTVADDGQNAQDELEENFATAQAE